MDSVDTGAQGATDDDGDWVFGLPTLSEADARRLLKLGNMPESPQALREVFSFARRSSLRYHDSCFLTDRFMTFHRKAWSGVNLDREMEGLPDTFREFAPIVKMLSRFRPLDEKDAQCIREFVMRNAARFPRAFCSSLALSLAERGSLAPFDCFPESFIGELIEHNNIKPLEEIVRLLVAWPCESPNPLDRLVSRLSRMDSDRLQFFVKLYEFLRNGPTSETLTELEMEFVGWVGLDNLLHAVVAGDLFFISRARGDRAAVRLCLHLLLELQDFRNLELLILPLKPDNSEDKALLQRVLICDNAVAANWAATMLNVSGQ